MPGLRKFLNPTCPSDISKIAKCNKSRTARTKRFDASNFLCAYMPQHSPRVESPALLRTMMRNTRTDIAGIAVHVQPLARLADGSCMSVMTFGPNTFGSNSWGLNVQLKAGLIRETRI